VVVISVGADNPHGYPHRAALSAYKTPGRRVFRTDQDGDVVIRVKPNGSYTTHTERTGGTRKSEASAPRSAGASPSTRSTTKSTSGSEASSGSLLVPVQGVPRSKLVDTYTQARARGRPHNAIDIAAPRGTPVVAVTGGRVLKLFKSVQGGTALYQLDPDGRTIYYYAHLDRFAPAMREGKTLRRGEVLGYVGNTGNSGVGNYHLHFGISITSDPKQYWGGRDINPYPRLRGAR
jgi:murein DD-endopeptidase MepM/ murein hydrolase activator NlpD